MQVSTLSCRIGLALLFICKLLFAVTYYGALVLLAAVYYLGAACVYAVYFAGAVCMFGINYVGSGLCKLFDKVYYAGIRLYNRLLHRYEI